MTTPQPDSPGRASDGLAELDALRALLATVKAPQARKVVRELLVRADGAPEVEPGEAVALAARFAAVGQPGSDVLLKMWGKVADPDRFAELLLVPAYVREKRTDLKVSKAVPEGLRHLGPLLRTLHLDRCTGLTDLAPIAGFDQLVSLDLGGCSGLDDLAPLAGLTGLESLRLHRCRKVKDIGPLLKLRALRRLDLSMTGVASVAGLGAALPGLEVLSLQGCRGLRDIHPLSGLRRLTTLDLGWTGIKDLSALMDVGAVTELDLTSCAHLTTLKGIGAMPGLRVLRMDKVRRLRSLDGLGHHPDVTELVLTECAELQDLRAIAGLPGLQTLELADCERLTSVAGVETLTGLDLLRVRDCTALSDFSSLAGAPAPRRLFLTNVDGGSDLGFLPELPGLRVLLIDRFRTLRTLDGAPELPDLRTLDVRHCPSLAGLGRVGELPELRRVQIFGCDILHDADGLAGRAPLEELRLEGVRQLESLDALAGSPTLRKVKIESCDRLKPPPMGAMTALRELEYRYQPWPDFDFLTGSTSIESVKAYSLGLLDISALAGLPALTTVDFSFSSTHELATFAPLLEIGGLTNAALSDYVLKPVPDGARVKAELRARGVSPFAR
ncbi:MULTISPECIES: leucine-rich repeat domain-containing protein [Streptomyces]|uniref:leucine-rich repeat domain-containing protein n=1 Tax=Streptomyces TaxID=1883 RepID=UPI00084C3566|nr:MULTISPECIES: leucine-rich repeat domain-containing protein [Streptomyces]TFI30594.1 leucine-rich repeat domain-containing protein [Streptomyces sp. 4R-3d]